MSGTTPQEIQDAGLAANPVHVLDLAIFLPAGAARGHAAAPAPCPRLRARALVLTAMGLFGVAIATIQLVFAARDLDGAVGVIAVMAILTTFTLAQLARFLRMARDLG